MAFELLKQLNDATETSQTIIEEFELHEMFDANGRILEEGTFRFFAWAKNIIDRPVLSDDQAERDPKVDAHEVAPEDVKDKEDMVTRFARMLSGLKFYADKADDEVKKLFVKNDKDVENNIKHHAVQKEVDLIKADLKTKARSYVRGLVAKLEKVYQVKGYGVA